MFFLEKERGTLPPGCTGTPIPKIGYFGWKTWELHFDDCRVPAEHMIGEEGQRLLVRRCPGLEDGARPYRGARHRPRPRRARGFDRLREASACSSAGRSPNSRRSASRSPTWRPRSRPRASSSISSASRSTPAGAATRKPRWPSSSPREMAERVTSEALQIHGGAGYTTDLPSSATGATPASPRSSKARPRSSCASSPTASWSEVAGSEARSVGDNLGAPIQAGEGFER